MSTQTLQRDPEELLSLASIAADRGEWSDEAVERFDEEAVMEARAKALNGSREQRALTALLGELRKEVRT